MATSYSRLPPLPALRDFINIYRLRAKKVLSQNYLMDMNLTRKIARTAGVQAGDWVCEVGPGPGGITRALLDAGAARVDVIEIDQRFLPPLRHLAEASEGRLNIHHADVLRSDVGAIWSSCSDAPSPSAWSSDDPPRMHIVGNLPFNIATPLVISYLKDMSYRRGAWSFGRVPLTLTFQLEVARRLCSPIACDTRSRISIMAQYVSEPQLIFQIPGSCFVPPPEIDVGVVHFMPRRQPLANTAFEVLEKMCRQVFHYRQKHVIKGLKTLYPKEMANDLAHEVLSNSRVDPTTTSMRLSVQEYAQMASIYEQQCKRIPGLWLYDYIKPKETVEILAAKPNCLPPQNAFVNAEIPSGGVRLRDFNIVS